MSVDISLAFRKAEPYSEFLRKTLWYGEATMTPENIPDLNAFAVAAAAALGASTATASEPQIALAQVLELPSAAELDRWLASPSRRAA